MLITIANQKGGTGKTALATLLTSYLLEDPQNADKIFPCDMDEQLSFTRRIKKINGYPANIWKNYLIIKNYLPQALEMVSDPIQYAGTQKDYCICDTAPGVLTAGTRMTQAILEADILIVPTTSDSDSVLSAVRVAKMHKPAFPSLAVIRQTGAARDREAINYLKEKGFANVLEMPSNTQMVTNFDAGKPWFYGLRNNQREVIKQLLKELLIIKN